MKHKHDELIEAAGISGDTPTNKDSNSVIFDFHQIDAPRSVCALTFCELHKLERVSIGERGCVCDQN